jgi:hypothetical protein
VSSPTVPRVERGLLASRKGVVCCRSFRLRDSVGILRGPVAAFNRADGIPFQVQPGGIANPSVGAQGPAQGTLVSTLEFLFLIVGNAWLRSA